MWTVVLLVKKIAGGGGGKEKEPYSDNFYILLVVLRVRINWEKDKIWIVWEWKRANHALSQNCTKKTMETEVFNCEAGAK